MCRLLAYSGTPGALRDLLLGAGSLESLACEHGSGWGIATWTGTSPVVRKEPVAADDPKAGWRDAVAAAEDHASVLAHIRLASIGRQTLENTHPFAHGPWAFAHNGTVHGFAARRDAYLAEVEPRVRAAVQGATDSEVAFALFLQRLLVHAPDFRCSIDDAAPALVAVARRLRREHPGGGDEPTATTFAAGNGDGFVLHRHGRELSTFQGEGYAVAASEPVGPHPALWKPVPEGATVLLQNGRVRIRPPV